jgi:hypothetical protein
MPLAIRAMAAVNTDRLSQKLVAHLATGTAAPRFLAFGIVCLFHILHVRRCISPGTAILRQQIPPISVFGFSVSGTFKVKLNLLGQSGRVRDNDNRKVFSRFTPEDGALRSGKSQSNLPF